MTITSLSPEQLRKAANLKEQIEALQAELDSLLGGEFSASVTVTAPATSKPARAGKGRKRFSAETRAKMAAAQKARWAAKKGLQKDSASPAAATAKPEAKPKRRKLSAAGRAAIGAAAKARWAKLRKAKAEAESKKPAKGTKPVAKGRGKKLDESVPF
jgi:hypothetical protein